MHVVWRFCLLGEIRVLRICHVLVLIDMMIWVLFGLLGSIFEGNIHGAVDNLLRQAHCHSLLLLSTLSPSKVEGLQNDTDGEDDEKDHNSC